MPIPPPSPLEKMAVCLHTLHSHFGIHHLGPQTRLGMLLFADQSAGWQDAVPRAPSLRVVSWSHWPDLHDLQLRDLGPNPHWLASLRRHGRPLGHRPGARPRQPEVPQPWALLFLPFQDADHGPGHPRAAMPPLNPPTHRKQIPGRMNSYNPTPPTAVQNYYPPLG